MRYFMTFSYDGTMYKGYQKQPCEMTIQQEIEKVLYKINGNKFVSIHATGRTDAGVHAINQKAHFDLEKNIPLERLKGSLNKMLPSDIYIKDIKIVKEDFHARYDVKFKEYIYKINMGEYNPIERNYVYQYNKELDIEKIKCAIKYFEGEHNFKSFTKSSDDREDYVRTIISTNVYIDSNDSSKLIISLKGTGFLRYMVRNIVGILIEIGEGKRSPSEIVDILKIQDRECAGKTAPACGLYLNDVFY